MTARRMPKAVADAKTGADLARALDVNPKAFRAWLRRKGVRLAKGATLDAQIKAQAVATFAKAPKAKAPKATTTK